ncbi:winged helix-turn-helix domain-containing protein, partial [Streptomyces sp. NPDC000188]
AVPAVAQALREAAEWVGCDAVRIERVDAPNLKPALVTALG